MKYLCIDTSVGAGVAILDDNQILIERHSASSRHHAETTVQLVSDCVSDLGFDQISEVGLDAIVVGRGPAPFTGLRVGLVVARTFGFALNIPVYGLCSLDAIAYAGVEQLGITPGQNFMVVTDARRKEVYCRIYNVQSNKDKGGIVSMDEPQVMSPSQAAELALSSQCGVIVYPVWPEQDNNAPYVDALNKLLPEELVLKRTKFHVGHVGNAFYSSYIVTGAELPTSTQPLYLRRPDIQGQSR